MEFSSWKEVKFPEPFEEIKSICYDAESNTLWIADFCKIKKLRNHDLSTLSTSAPLGSCGKMIFDSASKELIVSQPFRNQVAIIDTQTGKVEFVGNGCCRYRDGSYSEAQLVPYSLSLDKDRNILVGDSRNCCIRIINRQQRMVTSIGQHSSSGTGSPWYNSTDGPFRDCSFVGPNSIWFDPSTNTAIVFDGVSVRQLDFNLNVVTTIGNTSIRYFKDMIVWNGSLYILEMDGISKVLKSLEVPTPTLTATSIHHSYSDHSVPTQRIFSITDTKGFCLGPWGNVYTSNHLGKNLVVIYRIRNVGWKHIRLLWIGNMKEKVKDCCLAMLPRDVMWLIVATLIEM